MLHTVYYHCKQRNSLAREPASALSEQQLHEPGNNLCSALLCSAPVHWCMLRQEPRWTVPEHAMKACAPPLQVKRAAAFGNKRINFVITWFFRDNDGDAVPDAWCYRCAPLPVCVFHRVHACRAGALYNSSSSDELPRVIRTCTPVPAHQYAQCSACTSLKPR